MLSEYGSGLGNQPGVMPREFDGAIAEVEGERLRREEVGQKGREAQLKKKDRPTRRGPGGLLRRLIPRRAPHNS